MRQAGIGALGTWRREARQRREIVSLPSSEAAGAHVVILSWGNCVRLEQKGKFWGKGGGCWGWVVGPPALLLRNCDSAQVTSASASSKSAQSPPTDVGRSKIMCMTMLCAQERLMQMPAVLLLLLPVGQPAW